MYETVRIEMAEVKMPSSIRVSLTSSELFIHKLSSNSDEHYAYSVGSDSRLRFARKGE